MSSLPVASLILYTLWKYCWLICTFVQYIALLSFSRWSAEKNCFVVFKWKYPQIRWKEGWGREELFIFTADFWTDILKRNDVNIFSPPRVLNQLSQVAVRSGIVPFKVSVLHVIRRLKLNDIGYHNPYSILGVLVMFCKDFFCPKLTIHGVLPHNYRSVRNWIVFANWTRVVKQIKMFFCRTLCKQCMEEKLWK